jgi:hypothetical protein
MADWKVAHFDIKSQAAQNPLYAWSNLRSEYEAQASMQSARNILWAAAPIGTDPVGIGTPTWAMYGFIPGDGIWYSPFGWPFYSPWVVGLCTRLVWVRFPGYGHVGANFAALQGHGHVSGSAIASGGRFAGSARIGGGFGGGFAGGMHGGFGGGGRPLGN